MLGYLSHVDTVLADPDDWTHDPWGGEVHDGFLWGRGALDMKSQTAAEAVAAATLARNGWRPAAGRAEGHRGRRRGDRRALGAQVADRAAPRPGARRLPRSTRAPGRLGDAVRRPPPLRRLLRREGHVPLRRPRPRRRRPRVGAGSGDNALLKLAPVDHPARRAPEHFDVVDEAARAAHRARRGSRRSRRPRSRTSAPSEPGSRSWSSRRCASPRCRPGSSRPTKINVIPAKAELLVDCRVPPGMGAEADDATRSER